MSPDALTITQAHLDGFAAVSGDDNPIHVDPAFAAATAFGRPVAHGMFLFGLVSAAVHRRFPGYRMVGQELMFPAPTHIDTHVTVVVEVTDDGADPVSLITRVVHDDGTAGLRGTCTITRPPGADRGHVGAERAVPTAASTGAPGVAGEGPTSGGSVLGAKPAGGTGTSWWGRAVGRSASLVRSYTAADRTDYAELTGDIVTDGGIPAPLIGGLLSTLLGVHLPGPGTNYLKQSLRLVSTASVDEPLTATVQVARVVPVKRLVYLATTVTGRAARPIADGRALVLAGGIAPPR